MDLLSLEKLEMRSSPTHRVNADAPVNTWQEIFKSYSNQHHGFVDSLEQAMVLLTKYELETTTKFSSHKSGKMFGSGGKTLILQPRSHQITSGNISFEGCFTIMDIIVIVIIIIVIIIIIFIIIISQEIYSLKVTHFYFMESFNHNWIRNI